MAMNLNPDGDFPDGNFIEDTAVDRRIAEALVDMPSPLAPPSLVQWVGGRVKRRRLALRGGAMAAAALMLLGWSLFPSGDPAGVGGVADDRARQEALVAQWDQLLDEAAAMPAPIVELEVVRTQRELLSALERITAR
jgi:hypothetical protein